MIIAKVITAIVPTARRITARVISAVDDTGKICRYFFSFNADGNIKTTRRWNPDAVDASFEVLFYNDTALALDTTIIQQAIANGSSTSEFRINTLPSGAIRLTKGGTSISLLVSGSGFLGLGHWSIKYDANTGDNTISKYNDSTEQYDVLNTINSPTGLIREPTAGITIASNDNGTRADTGIMADVKFYVNGDRDTGTLVLDMPINDNSATIKDYSTTAIDGVLVAGTGTWDEVCDGDVINGVTYQGDDLVFNGDAVTYS